MMCIISISKSIHTQNFMNLATGGSRGGAPGNVFLMAIIEEDTGISKKVFNFFLLAPLAISLVK